MRLALATTTLALVGAAALIALPGVVRAGDESPHDTIEKLMPELMSQDDTVRTDAERKLFELGEPGRIELERVTRESDPRRAVTALRLLASGKWAKGVRPAGERRAEREDGSGARGDDPSVRLDDLTRSVERQFEEMRRRMEEFGRGIGTWKLPELGFHGEVARGKSSGSLVENDRTLSWTVEEDGRIKVTVKDGQDAAEQTFEARDLEELRKDHPELAKRVAPLLGNGHAYVFRLGPDRHVELFDGSGARRRLGDPFVLESPEAPVLGVEWSPVPDVLRDQVDLPAGGMVVTSVVKGSLAEKLGLARHDVLVEIDGKPVSAAPDVRAALAAVKAGEKVTAIVVRKGQRRTLDATK